MDTPETSPLLSRSPRSILGSESYRTPSTETKPSRNLIIFLLLAFLVLLDLGYELIMPAQTRVFERIYCRAYYEKHDPSVIGSGGRDEVDERLCKVHVIQGEVAMLKGWQITLDSIGMLLFSVPWAHIADTYGRKPVMLLLTLALLIKYAFIQFICLFRGAISLHWTWLSALHTIFGGSVTVATALIYTVISDVAPDNERIAVFFQVMAATIITQFLGPLLGAALMVRSPWVPMILGLGVELMSLVTLCFLPETLNYNDPIASADDMSVTPLELTQQRQPQWWRALRVAKNSVSFLISDMRILMAVSAFAVHMLFLHRDILLQYISTRGNTSLSQAAILISVRSGVIVLVSLIILPRISTYYRRKFGSLNADLFLSRISAAFLGLGFLGLGLASNLTQMVLSLILNSFGWGLFSFLRSFMTNLIDPHEVARLNSIIGIFDTVGLMIGSPLLANLFWKGLELQGFWFGLPFFFCGACLLVVILLLLKINISD